MFSYIHIPFCRQKCHYCKFALTPVFTDAKIALYLGHLHREIRDFFENLESWSNLPWNDSKIVDFLGFLKNDEIRAKNEHRNESYWKVRWVRKRSFEREVRILQKPLQSIYFGGGTPSVLSADQIRETVELFRSLTSFAPDIEITFETNPEDITPEYARSLREIGVNRVSLGVQSLESETLREVGRSNPEYVFHALDALFGAGFQNVNIDLIVGLPHVRPGGCLHDVQALHARYPLTHTSVYLLEDELYPASWTTLRMSEDDMRQEYLMIRDFLINSQWFNQYEISNFARPGFESRHNQGYWNHSESRGFGLSAASFVSGQRFANASGFSGYYRGDREYVEDLTPEALALERMMFGMRTFSLTRNDIPDPKKLDPFLAEWLLVERDGKILPTSTWIFLIDHIMGELI